jgi:regulatory protein
MPIVTKLTKQKKNKDYYNVFIDDCFTFSIHAELIILHGITKGKNLDLKEMEGIIEEDNKKRAFNLCLHYLSYRRRTGWELEEYLRKKNYSEETITEAINKLKYYKMVDDRDYIKSFIADKKLGNPIGRKKLVFDLRKKGISEDLLDNIEQWFTEEDEYVQAKELVIRYNKKYSKLPPREKIQKINQAGQRRGFSWEILKGAIQELIKDKEDFEENQIPQEVDMDKALQWLQKYKNRYEKKGLEGYALKQKIAQAMMGRGYKWDAIEKLLEILGNG